MSTISSTIPSSQATVKVSVIDNGARISGPMSMFMDPPILEHATDLSGPAYVFFVEHEQLGRKVVYDLGIRKDIAGYAPSVLRYHDKFSFQAGQDVYELLEDGGVDLKDIEAVIWSHHHIDHVGDPSGFPSTTDLVVGPGFKETELPGYPENAEAKILVSDYQGRNIRQLDFDVESNGLAIGGFRALDWFGDGSFYLLETPGHTIDHISALARTSVNPSRFIFMGGDIGHHASQWRPNQFIPLPKELNPSPFGEHSTFNIRRNVCPCACFLEHVDAGCSETEPFASIRGGHPRDVDMAKDALNKLQNFDSDDNIMVIVAHDWTLLDVMEYWPKPANDWYKAEWKERGQWKFLKDLVKVVKG